MALFSWPSCRSSSPRRWNTPLAFLLLGLLFNFNGLWVNIGWALAAAWLAQRAGLVRRACKLLDRVAGALFIWLWHQTGADRSAAPNLF